MQIGTAPTAQRSLANPEGVPFLGVLGNRQSNEHLIGGGDARPVAAIFGDARRGPSVCLESRTWTVWGSVAISTQESASAPLL